MNAQKRGRAAHTVKQAKEALDALLSNAFDCAPRDVKGRKPPSRIRPDTSGRWVKIPINARAGMCMKAGPEIVSDDLK